MNKRFKHLLFLVSILSIITLLFAACSNDDKNTGGDNGVGTTDNENASGGNDFQLGDTFKAEEELTFSMMFSDHPNYPYKKDWLFNEELKERTNVSLDMTIIPMSDYSEKRSLLISTGDSPLIIPKMYPGEETPFVASGTLLPVSDYIDLMPNFKDKVEKWEIEPFLEELRQEDGKYYLLPGVHENVWPDYTLAIRTDILEELELEMPTTWDELEVVLEEMKEAYPDVTPFSDRFTFDSTLNVAASSFGTSAGWGLGSALNFDEENDEFVFGPATEGYKEMVTYFRGLVEKGLLDPESFTQDDEQAQRKFVNGDSFVINTNSQTIVDYRNDMNEILGEDNFSIQKMLVPGGPEGQVMTGSKLENGIAISSKAKDLPEFEELMNFIDWLWYSDEGQEFTKWGVEGVTFNKDDDGKRVLADDVNYVGLNPAGTKALNVDYGFAGGNFAYGGPTELLHSMFSEEEIEFQEGMHATKELILPDPPITYNEMELEQSTLLSTPLKDFVSTATFRFILGDRDLSEWDEYVAELENMNVQGYVDLANEVYERNK